MPTRGAYRVADAAVGSISAFEEGTVGLDERFEQRQCDGGILRQQLAIHLVQPSLQLAPELARLAVAEKLWRTASGGQRLAKPGRELVWSVGQLQPRQPRLHSLVLTTAGEPAAPR